MSTLLAVLGVLVPSLATIIVSAITVRGERSKKVEALEKLAAEKESSKRDQELKEKLQELTNSISTFTTRLGELDKTIGTLQATDKETKRRLREMSRQQQINGEYIYELSKLVTVLAEGMRDQHLDGNITNAVSSFRQFEREKLSKLINQAPPEDDP